ncbi:exported hypothetical protein [Paraburkholderia ribeironis]|uniref:Secreted protein n=1 Tax=Paraburkholderia ribeironis TaxID=1247936 RepID=A0A1N7RW00_9BURK|nr:exported hypothetical protein [Paraburkholderia ribeironis]
MLLCCFAALLLCCFAALLLCCFAALLLCCFVMQRNSHFDEARAIEGNAANRLGACAAPSVGKRTGVHRIETELTEQFARDACCVRAPAASPHNSLATTRQSRPIAR